MPRLTLSVKISWLANRSVLQRGTWAKRLLDAKLLTTDSNFAHLGGVYLDSLMIKV
jgi:hypothetical protein